MLIGSVIVMADHLKWGRWKWGAADCDDVTMEISGLI